MGPSKHRAGSRLASRWQYRRTKPARGPIPPSKKPSSEETRVLQAAYFVENPATRTKMRCYRQSPPDLGALERLPFGAPKVASNHEQS